jgi:hypothetical protein
MTGQNKPSGKHFKKSLVWLAGSSLIGFAPLLFLKFINVLSEENLSAKEMEHIIEDGVILFVLCSITGTVVFDFILSKIPVKGWLPVLGIYVSPFLMLTFLFLKYLQVYVQFDDVHEFGPGTVTIWITVIFSVIYCLAVKSIYYWKEEVQSTLTKPGYQK